MNNRHFAFLACVLISLFSCQTDIEKEELAVYEGFYYQNLIHFYPQQPAGDAINRALELQSRLERPSLRSARWEWLGPSNIAGRMLCVAVNPADTNIVWAGSASAGLWKSCTGGRGRNAWSQIRLPFTVNAISSIAIDPSDPEIIYVGTGEAYSYEPPYSGKYIRTMRGNFGIGILKTDDGGSTWSMVLDWRNQANRCIWRILIDPVNTGIIYASGTHGIFRSLDKGRKWTQISGLKMVTDLIIRQDSTNILLAGAGGIGADDFGIFRTDDGGDTWKKITTAYSSDYRGRIMLASNPRVPQKTYALLSDSFKTITLLRSSNFFRTWQTHSIQDITSYQGWYTRGMLSNVDGRELLIGGVDLFVDRTGGFNSFERYQMGKIGMHADFHEIAANPKDPKKVFFATDGGIFRSDDFGVTFYGCNDGLNTSQFYSVNFSTNGQTGIGGLQDNRSALYLGDLNWQLTHVGDGTASLIHPANPWMMLCAAQNLYLSYSSDAGINWINTLQDEQSCFVTPLKANPRYPDQVYTASTIFYKSSDFGVNFKKIIPGTKRSLINTLELSSKDTNVIVYSTLPENGTKAGLYISTDGGWNARSISDGLPDRVTADIQMVSDSDLIVALGGYGSPHLFRSSDLGHSWKAIDNGLPDVPFHTVLHVGTAILAGSEIGLYASADEGGSWSLLNEDPERATAVYDLSLRHSGRSVAVATHGSGIYSIDPDYLITSINGNNKSAKHLNRSFNYKYPPTELMNENSLEVLDISGKLMNGIDFKSGHGIENLPAGLYFITCGGSLYRMMKDE